MEVHKWYFTALVFHYSCVLQSISLVSACRRRRLHHDQYDYFVYIYT